MEGVTLAELIGSELPQQQEEVAETAAVAQQLALMGLQCAAALCAYTYLKIVIFKVLLWSGGGGACL